MLCACGEWTSSSLVQSLSVVMEEVQFKDSEYVLDAKAYSTCLYLKDEDFVWGYTSLPRDLIPVWLSPCIHSHAWLLPQPWPMAYRDSRQFLHVLNNSNDLEIAVRF